VWFKLAEIERESNHNPSTCSTGQAPSVSRLTCWHTCKVASVPMQLSGTEMKGTTCERPSDGREQVAMEWAIEGWQAGGTHATGVHRERGQSACRFKRMAGAIVWGSV
jgi:hypothetical protein